MSARTCPFVALARLVASLVVAAAMPVRVEAQPPPVAHHRGQ